MSAYKRVLGAAVLAGTLLTGCSSSTDSLPRLAPDAVILAFGDSLTFGTGANSDQSYPAVLENLSGRTVINAGNPGEVSADGLRRLPGEVDAQEPDLVVLCHGGNDILRKFDRAQTRENLTAMIEYLHDSEIPVVLIGVPDFGLFLNTADMYLEVADDTGVIIEEDIIADLLSDNQFKSDQVHPNAAGYERLAESIQTLLEQHGAL